jgi:hypothetical protein
MDLFTSSALSGQRRSVLLAPASYQGTTHRGFSAIRRNSGEHAHLLAEAQRLRGRVYLADGAIERWQLTDSGRHVQPADHRAFHLLSLDDAGRVAACTRYLAHDNTVGFTRLGVAHTPLVADGDRRPKLERAVEGELARARRLGYRYVEMGGWAITEQLRCTTEAVRMVVTIYALARMMGGALGISTVTTRHASSSILRRLGGAPLTCESEEVPAYYDPNYGCEMEILRFDSDHPSETYEPAIRRCHAALARTPVIVPETADVRIPMLAPLATVSA